MLTRAVRAGGLFLTICHSYLCFAPTSPNNLDHFRTVCKIFAHLLHPAYDNGKCGAWEWWE